MSKFNIALKAPRTRTTNLAGGAAYKQTDRLEFASILLTSFLKDQFYRTEAATVARLTQLLQGIDPQFAARCAIYARHEFGMRSVTHFVAAWIGLRVKGQTWTKHFFNRVVRRPDDVTEILACYFALAGGPTAPIPNSMKRGLGVALANFPDYQVAKYRQGGADLKLVDAVNLLHPPHTPALEALVKGTLLAADTWETALSRAGQSDNEDAPTKAEEWARLVTEKRLGYMALVRNLRNILTHAPHVVDSLCEQLVDEAAIKRSLMFPFRFLTALDVVTGLGGAGTRKVMTALNRAIELSLSNVPKFDGRTLVAIDESGSMKSAVSGLSTCHRVASLFGATLLKANPDADLLLFATRARYVTVNTDDSLLTVANAIPFGGGGTNFRSIFDTAYPGYDRVVILSDMQGWMSSETPAGQFHEYRRKHDARTRVYSFDLAGHGSLQFPEPDVYCLAGFSDKVFDIMGLFETDRQALLSRIDQVNFTQPAQ